MAILAYKLAPFYSENGHVSRDNSNVTGGHESPVAHN